MPDNKHQAQSSASQLLTVTREALIVLLETSGLPNSNRRIDLTQHDLNGLNLNGIRFHHVIFSEAGQNRRRRISDTQFRDCIFLDCSFPGIELADVAFRGAQFVNCDFRYTSFRNNTFTEGKLLGCDFYRSNFEGNNVFERATFTHCSLHLASLAGADIRRGNLRQAIVQEYREEFERFLTHFGVLPSEKIKHLAALGQQEAVGIYRALSGLWAVKGFLGDATWAYVRARRLEVKCKRPLFAWKAPLHDAFVTNVPAPVTSKRVAMVVRAFFGYLTATVMDLICGFGSSLSRVLLTMLIMIVLFAAVYDLCGALERVDITPHSAATFLDCLNFSLHKVMATSPDQIQIRTHYELISALETAAGLGLIGLFGFVLGNYVRNS